MILLYELPQNEKGELVTAFLTRIKKPFRRIGKNDAGAPVGTLLAGGDGMPASADVIGDAAIFFAADVPEDEARQILDLLAQVGIQFRYQVLVSEEVAAKDVATVLAEQAAYMAKLKEMKRLQELIDACGKLRQEDYDPDRWSEMKFAIADANDALDALMGEDAEERDAAEAALPTYMKCLENAVNRLLTYRPQGH